MPAIKLFAGRFDKLRTGAPLLQIAYPNGECILCQCVNLL